MGDFQRVFAVAFHPQGQRFQALQNQEDVHRADGGAGIAQRHHAGAGDEGGGAEVFAVVYAVVRHIGRGQYFEALGVCRPIEFAAVDNGAADAVAVAVDVFGE